MMNVEEKREIIPVTLGAMAIALSLVIWHLGSDKETMLGLLLFLMFEINSTLLAA
jgi:hypothetical protein